MKISKIQLRKIIMNEVKRILKEDDSEKFDNQFKDKGYAEFDTEFDDSEKFDNQFKDKGYAEFDIEDELDTVSDDDDFDPESYKMNPYGYRTQKSIDDEIRQLTGDMSIKI